MLSMDRELEWRDHSVFYRFRAVFSVWLYRLSATTFLLLCLTTYVSLFLYPLFLMIFGYPIASTSGRYCFSIILIYTLYWIRDIDTPYRGGRRCRWLRNLSLWKWASQYPPGRLVISEELRDWGRENGCDITEKEKSIQLPTSFNYLLGYHPHGTYATGAHMAFSTESLNFSSIFPGITPYMTSLNCFYYVPFFREYVLGFVLHNTPLHLELAMTRMDFPDHSQDTHPLDRDSKIVFFNTVSGFVSIGRESLVYLLDKDITGTSGNLVGVVVGGVREIIESRPGRYVLVFSRRRGFFRLALQTGCHLVPSIGFGETNVYDQLPNPEGSRLRKLQEWIVDKTRMPPLFCYSTRVIPYRRPITVVIGRPIVRKRIGNPTNEEVDELMEEYKQQLVQMFNKYRPLYDPTAEDIRFI